MAVPVAAGVAAKEAAAPIIAAGVNAISTAINNKAQRDYNTSMMEYQNQYNSPAAQLERYKQAGLSPVGMRMSEGTLYSGNMSAQPLPYNPQSVVDAQTAANMLVAQKQAEKYGEEAQSERTLRGAKLDALEAQNAQFLANVANLNANTTSTEIANRYADLKYQYELAGKRMDINLSGWQIRRLNQEIKNMDYQLKKVFPAEVQKYLSEKVHNYADVERITAAAADLREAAALKGAEREKVLAEIGLVEDEHLNKILSNENLQQMIDTYMERFETEMRGIASRAALDEEQTYFEYYRVMSQLYGSMDFKKWNYNQINELADKATESNLWSKKKIFSSTRRRGYY